LLLDFVAALATANARIASLEAELRASQKAYDAAATAKANAEKLQKAALGKTKKAEKALADINKERAQREQAVAERLRTMSASAEGKHFAFIFCLSTYAALVYLIILVSFFPFPLCRFDRYISVVATIGR
jgi:Flp pilus assembly protein TadB